VYGAAPALRSTPQRGRTGDGRRPIARNHADESIARDRRARCLVRRFALRPVRPSVV